jgi:hypothetical protein
MAAKREVSSSFRHELFHTQRLAGVVQVRQQLGLIASSLLLVGGS